MRVYYRDTIPTWNIPTTWVYSGKIIPYTKEEIHPEMIPRSTIANCCGSLQSVGLDKAYEANVGVTLWLSHTGKEPVESAPDYDTYKIKIGDEYLYLVMNLDDTENEDEDDSEEEYIPQKTNLKTNIISCHLESLRFKGSHRDPYSKSDNVWVQKRLSYSLCFLDSLEPLMKQHHIIFITVPEQETLYNNMHNLYKQYHQWTCPTVAVNRNYPENGQRLQFHIYGPTPIQVL